MSQKNNTLAIIATIASKTRTKLNVTKTPFISASTLGRVPPLVANMATLSIPQRKFLQPTMLRISHLLHPQTKPLHMIYAATVVNNSITRISIGRLVLRTSPMSTNLANVISLRNSFALTISDNISNTVTLAQAESGPTCWSNPA